MRKQIKVTGKQTMKESAPLCSKTDRITQPVSKRTSSRRSNESGPFRQSGERLSTFLTYHGPTTSNSFQITTCFGGKDMLISELARIFTSCIFNDGYIYFC